MKPWKVRKPRDWRYNGGASINDNVKMEAHAVKKDIERAEKEFRDAMEWEL